MTLNDGFEQRLGCIRFVLHWVVFLLPSHTHTQSGRKISLYYLSVVSNSSFEWRWRYIIAGSGRYIFFSTFFRGCFKKRHCFALYAWLPIQEKFSLTIVDVDIEKINTRLLISRKHTKSNETLMLIDGVAFVVWWGVHLLLIWCPLAIFLT